MCYVYLFVLGCLTDEELRKGMTYGGLAFPDTGCPVPDVMCVCDCIVQFHLQMYSMYIYGINDFWFWFCQYFLNSLRPRQNRRNFTDDVFKCNFLNENILILIKISLKLVPKGPINNIPAFVQIMAWRRTGAIIWTNDDPVQWGIYASLGPNGFIWNI